MPKVTKVGKFRAAARATSRDVRSAPLTSEHLAQKKNNEDADADATSNPAEKEVLSRGQKKRQAKREQYLKREKMVMSSLRLQKLEEQKGKLDGLDAIREALGASSPSAQSMIAAAKEISEPVNSKTTKSLMCNTNKEKKTLANAEISHMGLVLKHPSFQENPFAAIQQHLRNSLLPDAEKLKQDSMKRDEADKVAAAKKKEVKKEAILDAKFSRKRRFNKADKYPRR